MLARSFYSTEWTKPKFIHKPYSERRARDLPLIVHTTRGHKKVRYGDLWNLWDKTQTDLFKTGPNRNISAIFASLSTYGRKNDDTVRDKEIVTIHEIFHDEQKSKKQHVDALLRTYAELQADSSPKCKKWRYLDAKNELATLNATTANADEGEKLTQKVETIEEVPLVEAEPDIIKPPKTTGPAVMNMTAEETAMNSDFQVSDDLDNVYIYCKQYRDIEEPLRSLPQYKKFFESELTQKTNINEMVTLNSALPELNLDDNLSLTELLRRVRQRNRLSRCLDIGYQLSTSVEGHGQGADKSRFLQPANMPHWQAWPYQQPQRSFPMQPLEPRGSPRKAEPIRPDSRPPGQFNRTSKVDPVTLALHLGPLVSCLRHAAILFPLMTYTQTDYGKYNPLAKLTDGVKQELVNFWKLLSSVHTEEEDLPVDVALNQDHE